MAMALHEELTREIDAGPAGVRQFRSGVRLEAGFVRFADGPPVALPLADLERFG